jgi:D-alanyl-D-alanine carboxypeptidase/D-alanyl-D-alanine-endopeptidase (penicillin-binding protein 4)
VAFVLVCSFLLTPASSLAQELSGSERALGKQLLALLQSREAQQAYWGIEVVAVEDGKELVGWNQNKLFEPASTAKLFPAAVALARLGADFKYHTTVEASHPPDAAGVLSGDLFLVGRGDPNLSARVLPYTGRTERTEFPTKIFQDLAADLFARGVRTVTGNLVADDSYFVWRPYGPGWEIDDVQWGYGAPVSALAINDNVTVVRMTPGSRAGDPARVRLEPLADYYQLDNQLLTVAPRRTIPGGGTAGAESALGMDRSPGSALLRIWGQIPQRSGEWARAVAIEDPPRYAAEVFRQEMTRLGMEVKGSVTVKRLQPVDVADLKGASAASHAPAGVLLADHESDPLAESLKVMLKVSQNLHAEMLLRTLGRERRNVGSNEAGQEEVKDFAKQIGIQDGDVLLQDGSGLSRQNLVTPAAVVKLLRHMHDSELGAIWKPLLPVAGQDGSLTGRLAGRGVTGRVWAKTGSLSGVAALAGYVLNQDDEPLAFAIFANHHSMSTGAADALIDRIVQLLARSR